jgi:hypothetical protein
MVHGKCENRKRDKWEIEEDERILIKYLEIMSDPQRLADIRKLRVDRKNEDIQMEKLLSEDSKLKSAFGVKKETSNEVDNPMTETKEQV